MTAYETHLGEQVDRCDVCGIPLEPPIPAIKQEYLGTIYTFCSSEHAKEFLENPEKYTRFPEDEEPE